MKPLNDRQRLQIVKRALAYVIEHSGRGDPNRLVCEAAVKKIDDRPRKAVKGLVEYNV